MVCALTAWTIAVPVNGGGVEPVLRKFRKLCGPTQQPNLMSLPIYEYISNTDLYEDVKKITTIVQFYIFSTHTHTPLLEAHVENANQIDKINWYALHIVNFVLILAFYS